MCRNIKPLFNFDPPATDAEIRAASLQYVRKLSGFNKPAKANTLEFEEAVNEVAKVTKKFLNSFYTDAKPKNREVEERKARERSAKRFGVKP